jgi:hypothetical protein
MKQLTMLGGLTGADTFEPWKEGDILVTKSGRRHVVTTVSDNIHGLVFVTTALDTGATCVVLEREVAYRSR